VHDTKMKGGLVMLCLPCGKIQRFKMKNLVRVTMSTHVAHLVVGLERVPAPENRTAESLIEPSSTSLSMMMDSLVEPSLKSSNLTSSKSTTACLIMERSMSSLEEYNGEEVESSMSTLSSDVEEEYGNSLRVLMNAFVNFLEEAQQVNQQAIRNNIKHMAQQLIMFHGRQFLYAEQHEALTWRQGNQVSNGTP